MNDISDGELNFTDRKELEAWLETQPRQAGVVIAARAALRTLPLLHRSAMREPRGFATLTLASFWASALARFAAKYPTRAQGIRGYAYAAADADDAAVRATAAADAATQASAQAAAGAARAAYAAAAYAADAAARTTAAAYSATAAAYSAYATVWAAVAADARRLLRARPDVLAGEMLWLVEEPA